METVFLNNSFESPFPEAFVRNNTYPHSRPGSTLKPTNALSRLCSKVLKKGSFFSGFLILTASIGGSGMLALPYTFKMCGWPAGMCTIIFCMLINIFTCYIVVQATVKKSIPTLDQLFCDSVEINLPHVPEWVNSLTYKVMLKYTQLNIVLNNYGGIIVYIIAVTTMQGETLMERALNLMGHTGSISNPYIWAAILTVILIVVLVLPFAHVNEVAFTRYPSLLSFLMFLYVAGVIVGEFFSSESGISTSPDWTIQQQLRNFPIILFIYATQSNIGVIVQMACIQDLKKKEQGLMVLVSAMTCLTLMFLCVSFSGYFTTGSRTQSNVFQEERYNNTASITVCDTQAMLVMTIALLSTTPIMIHPLVTVIYHMLGEHRKLSSRLAIGTIVVGMSQLVILASATAIAMVSQAKFSFVIEIVGTMACSYLCVILPCVWYIKCTPEDEPPWILPVCWVVLIGMTSICVASFVAVIMEGLDS